MSHAIGNNKREYSLNLLLQDIGPNGSDMDWIVTPEQLELPSDDGRMLSNFHWIGHVTKLANSEGEAFFQGTLFGTIVRECVRCLQEFQDPMAIAIQGTFQHEHKKSVGPPRGRRMNEPMTLDELEDEWYPCDGIRLVFAPIFREHVILATPLQPLCTPECRGLCQDCGQNLNHGVCGCADKPAYSPHFANLQALADRIESSQPPVPRRSKSILRRR
ncbi:MAG: DUF177 domain-containing protein [Nitrospirae bacterium]|nr:MAG: DUF177 domain-containing protein [Nitrospirota bacterium]